MFGKPIIVELSGDESWGSLDRADSGGLGRRPPDGRRDLWEWCQQDSLQGQNDV
jgi:hypothetical protein